MIALLSLKMKSEESFMQALLILIPFLTQLPRSAKPRKSKKRFLISLLDDSIL